jgi:CRP/FNR family cyclic AMP-dependent transcriptional regulator
MMSRIPLWLTLRLGQTAAGQQPAAFAEPPPPRPLLAKRPPPLGGAQRLAEKIGYLREIDIFCDLTPEDMTWLEQTTAMFTCPKGQIIYAPGETGEILFLLKRGRVQIYRLSAEGKKLVVATLEAGTFFGEMNFVGQGMYESFAEALEPSVVCALSRPDLIRLVQAKPMVAVRLLHAVGQRLVETQAALEDLAFKPVPARLAALLLRLQKSHGDVIEGISHQELADMAGTLRETATETLDEFKAAGWIETGRRKLVIRDAAALQAVAANTRSRPATRL